MNNFINSKYGQNKILSVLLNFVKNNTVPHAFLFSGLEGVGKFYIAQLYAEKLNEAYGIKPEILSKIKKLEEPYIKFVFPMPRGRNESENDTPYSKLDKDQMDDVIFNIKEKSINPFYNLKVTDANNIKISSIKDIHKFLLLDYNDIKFRFVIILDAHLMSDEAQNSLLKNLEEPPNGIIFILITPFKDRLLNTILSRCWNINFESLSVDEVENILVDYFNLDYGVAKNISYFSEGSVQNALNLYEQGNEKLLEDVINFLRFCLVKKYNSAFKIIETYLEDRNKIKLELFFEIVKKWFVDSRRFLYTENVLYFENHKETIQKFNQKFSQTDVAKIFTTIEKAQNKINKNINLNIIAMNVIFEISTLGLR